MKKYIAFILCLLAFSFAGAAELKEIASWDFGSNDPLNSGTFPLKLRGDAKIENGMLICGGEDINKPNGAVMVKNDKAVTPKDAFSITVEFMLDDTLKRQNKGNAILWDSKYVMLPKNKTQHKGFQLAVKTGKSHSFVAAFGFGDKSASATSNSITLTQKEKHTVKMIFTATGKVTFICDGKNLGTKPVPTGPIVHSAYPPVIGDRHSTNYSVLGGGIYKVTLKEEQFIPIEVMADTYFRKVFERGEENVAVHGIMANFSKEALKNVTIQAETLGKALPDTKIQELAAGQKFQFSYKIDSYLLPGKYELKCKAIDADGKEIGKVAIPYTIVHAYGDFMPVVLWGGGTISDVKGAGFTHMGSGIFPISGDFNKSNLPGLLDRLDTLLENGLYVYTSVYAKYRFMTSKRFQNVNRKGEPYKRAGLEASHPEVRREFADVMAQTAQAVGDHPAWDATLLNSEIRGTASPSFTGNQEANFKKYAGYDIPADIEGGGPKTYHADPKFPWNRIIDPKEPHYVYYTWFKRNGDGWNDLQTLLSDTLHKYVKHHHFTFHDPAVRVLPLWGSGGNVDVISQWTYTNPDPIKIGEATDEMLAMADGNPGQKVMKMTQAIWYRRATAPMEVNVKNPPEWLAREKKAAFITIAPDFVREAIWSKVSRKIDGIMYHGSGSLLTVQDHGYRYTNPESKKVLADTVARVIRPLGPTLKKIPERLPEVAILESATGWLYASSHATGGWSGNWTSDLHLALQWANIQPSIIYEEHLLTNLKLDNLKVIIIPGAEVLTETVLAKLQELQSKGVIIIGDEFTTPGLMVDFRLKSIKRLSKDPKGSKEAFQKLGKEIAAMLKPYYSSPIEASNQDLVIRRRGNDSADYVFVLNDKRTFGDYLGQWGMVMEKGLSNQGTINVKHNAAVAYDLVNHQKVNLSTNKGQVSFNVDLNAGDGTLVLLLDREVNDLKVTLPKAPVALGGKYNVNVQVLDKKKQAIKAYFPIEVKITDAKGNELPGSGFYSTIDGALDIPEVAAANMNPGKVTVQVKDLASGMTKSASFQVK